MYVVSFFNHISTQTSDLTVNPFDCLGWFFLCFIFLIWHSFWFAYFVSEGGKNWKHPSSLAQNLLHVFIHNNIYVQMFKLVLLFSSIFWSKWDLIKWSHPENWEAKDKVQIKNTCNGMSTVSFDAGGPEKEKYICLMFLVNKKEMCMRIN